ncbi:MAG: hypothetical protein FJY86_03255 [Candidatus Diapherotrites archaeon]|uniref:Uncharacterized protein n=1 Tax=Candidatus Iainarchaeum sp. TaxID=3101447 RepID=A0A8T4C7C9_9ARCH|nr:hypothetical protein [Candidatus Diapherotrites archaeon]
MVVRKVFHAGRWVRAGLLLMGAVSCASVDKGGPGERVPWMVSRAGVPTRTGTSLTLLGLDVVHQEGTNKAMVVPSVVGWSETGWKGVGLNWIASADVNNEQTQFLAAGIAKELFEGKATVGVRGFSTPWGGENALLAAKLNLPSATKFYYSVDPEIGPPSQQTALRHTFDWKGRVLDLVVRGDTDHWNVSLGAEYAWGRNAFALARDIENRVTQARYTRGLGDGVAQLSVFGGKTDHGGKHVGIGLQIALDSVTRKRRPRRPSGGGKKIFPHSIASQRLTAGRSSRVARRKPVVRRR